MRASWVDDLATLAADALEHGRSLGPLALIGALLIGITGSGAPAIPLATGLVAAALWRRGRPPREIANARLAVTCGLALVGVAVAILDAERVTYAAWGGALLATTWAAAIDPPRAPRRGLLVTLLMLALACTLWLGDHALRPVPVLASLAALAGITRRGRWLPWTLVTAIALSMSSGGLARLPHLDLAGPVFVVLAIRTAAAVRGNPGTRADASASIATRIARRPWRVTTAAIVLACVVSLDVYASIDSATGFRSRSEAVALGFFALPGLAALTACVIFHALLRNRSPFDLAPPLLVPVVGTILVWLGAVALATRGFTHMSGLDVRDLMLVTAGVGPMLPVLIGGLFGRAEIRRARTIYALPVVLLAAGIAVWPLAPGDSALEAAFGLIRDESTRLQVMWVLSIPALIAVHRLAASPVSGRALLLGGAALSGAAGSLAATHLHRSAPHYSTPPLAWGLHVAAIFALTTVMTVAAVVLARRLRELTPLPADHAVLHWQAALAADNARHERPRDPRQ